jgi:hypothetical protein
LKPGNEVYIPKNLLKTRKSIKVSQPAAALSKPAIRTPVIQPESEPVLAEDEDIKLFGPKQHSKQ